MSDFLVIGGGIIGMLTARELAAAGASVTLLEKGETGTEASWAGGGIISPLYPWRFADPVTRLARWSQATYPALCDDVRERTGADPEFTRNGLLILEAGEAQAAHAWAGAQSIPLATVDTRAIAELEPGLAGPPKSGLWFPEIGQVRNPRLVRGLRLALARDIEIRERAEVLELMVRDGRVVGARTPSGVVQAGRVIVCAGAWTAELFAQLGARPNITPVRGQMILFYAQPGDVQRIVLRNDHYAIPRRDGRLLLGSTVEHTGFEKEITPRAREELHQLAVDMFPRLRQAPVEKHWAGLRPGSPSGIPYIGAYPGIEGLYFNAGHFRNGVVLGPASARLMADIALDRPPIVPPEPYAMDAPRG